MYIRVLVSKSEFSVLEQFLDTCKMYSMSNLHQYYVLVMVSMHYNYIVHVTYLNKMNNYTIII